MGRLQAGAETTEEDEAIYGVYLDDIEEIAQEIYFYREEGFPSLQKVRDLLGILVWRVCGKERGE
jgi:hypothetical protein